MEKDNKNKEYNRLVIIGNGLDLALGFETSYSHFILAYIKNTASTLLKGENLKNALFKVNPIFIGTNIPGNFMMDLYNYKDVKELVEFLKFNAGFEPINTFFEKIIDNYSKSNWIDIEQHYYDTLKEHYFNEFKKNKFIANVKSLNECMDALAFALNDYISNLKIRITHEHRDKFLNFLEALNEPLPYYVQKLMEDFNREKPPEEIMFVNFNYTNTIKELLRFPIGNKKFRHINIHGKVDNDENPIIFGYGDDIADEYHELESANEVELLRKIKSFQYPKTTNYHQLLGFLESGDFDIYIIGHSCGLSDRTLLKTIFEHKRCIAIRIFHYDEEKEHFLKRIEISRHFDDKIKMRQRLLPFDKFAAIPQFK